MSITFFLQKYPLNSLRIPTQMRLVQLNICYSQFNNKTLKVLISVKKMSGEKLRMTGENKLILLHRIKFMSLCFCNGSFIVLILF